MLEYAAVALPQYIGDISVAVGARALDIAIMADLKTVVRDSAGNLYNTLCIVVRRGRPAYAVGVQIGLQGVVVEGGRRYKVDAHKLTGHGLK